MTRKNREKKRRITKIYDRLASAYGLVRPRLDKSDLRIVTRLLELTDGEAVLDVGTGPGIFPLELRKRGYGNRVVGIDLSAKSIAVAEKRAKRKRFPNLDFREGDMEKLEFDDGRFHRVTCIKALLLVPDRLKAAREFHRVLAPGGIAVIVEPKAGKRPLRKRAFDWSFGRCFTGLKALKPDLHDVDFCDFMGDNRFTQESLEVLMRQAGFQDVTTTVRRDDIFAQCRKAI